MFYLFGLDWSARGNIMQNLHKAICILIA